MAYYGLGGVEEIRRGILAEIVLRLKEGNSPPLSNEELPRIHTKRPSQVFASKCSKLEIRRQR